MGWFNKKEEVKERVAFNYLYPRYELFKLIDKLNGQAESHFNAGELDVCESILEVLIKHVKLRKQIKVVDASDYQAFKRENETPCDFAIRMQRENI